MSLDHESPYDSFFLFLIKLTSKHKIKIKKRENHWLLLLYSTERKGKVKVGKNLIGRWFSKTRVVSSKTLSSFHWTKALSGQSVAPCRHVRFLDPSLLPLMDIFLFSTIFLCFCLLLFTIFLKIYRDK